MSRSPPRNARDRSPRGRGNNNRSFWTTTNRDLDRVSWRREPTADGGPPPPPSRSPYGTGRSYPAPGEAGRGRSFSNREGGDPERRPYPSADGSDEGIEGDSHTRSGRYGYRETDFRRYGSRGGGRGRGRGPPRRDGFVGPYGGQSNGYRPVGGTLGPPAGGPSPRGPSPGSARVQNDGAEVASSSQTSFIPGPDSTRFNASEALRVFQQRWQAVCKDMEDKAVPEDERPQMYKGDKKGEGGNSVWGQSKLPLQPSVSDFLSELQAALMRSESSENGDSKAGTN